MSSEEGARTGSRGPLFGSLLLLAVVVALGVWWFLRGDAPVEAPAVAEADTTERTVVTNTAAAPVERRKRDLPPPTGECGLTLRVVDWQGAVAEGAVVDAQTDPETAMADVETDARGRAEVSPIACGSTAFARISAPGGKHHFESFSAEQVLSGAEIEVQLPRFVLMVGRVEDPDGRPVPEARIHSDAAIAAQVDAEGRFRVWVSPMRFDPVEMGLDPEDPEVAALVESRGNTAHVGVFADGYETAFEQVPLPTDPDVTEVQHDVTLVPARVVRVRCEGRGKRGCWGLHNMRCTGPDTTEGATCSTVFDEAGETALAQQECHCPAGPATVSAEGVSTDVQHDDDEVTLVFTGATLTGTLHLDGAPTQAHLTVRKQPRSLEEHIAPAAYLGFQSALSRASDGRFRIDAVQPGPTTIWCRDGYGRDGVEGLVAELDVPESGTVDLGTVECRTGGSIIARVQHAETGTPFVYAKVDAQQVGGDLVVSQIASGADAEALLSGLPAGSWRLSISHDPTVTTVVQVEEGVETDGVVLKVGDEMVMPETGLILESEWGEDGSVGILDVLPDTPAARAGLVAGDRLLRGWIDGKATGLMDGEEEGEGPPPDAAGRALAVAHAWDGPGLTFTVDRDGEEVPVEFDW